MSRLDDIKARVEAATPGPWVADGDHVRSGPMEPTLAIGNHGDGYVTSHMVDSAPGLLSGSRERVLGNADFIAAARTDVPLLLAVAEAAMAMVQYDDPSALVALRASLAPLLEDA